MKSTWIEWIPNISIGRDLALLAQIDQLFSNTQHIHVLHKDVGWDANRTVYTIVGQWSGLTKAVTGLLEILSSHQTMENHIGNHPRIGALDVCPFVPLTPNHEQNLQHQIEALAENLSHQFNFPIYLYEKSSKQPQRQNLATIRQGEYEGLAEKLKKKEWQPDYGANFNPILGATVMGHRDFLIAYNVNLPTNDVSIAKKIAQAIRSKGKPLRSHALPGLKAIGWYMEKLGYCQVSTNIVNIHQTNPYEVFTTIEKLAQSYDLKVTTSELIGLIPGLSLAYMTSKYSYNSQTLTQKLGLSYGHISDLEKRTIEYLLALKAGIKLSNE